MMAARATQPVVLAAMRVARRAVVEQVPVVQQAVAVQRVQRAVVR
jgi:hypothetical protein